MNDRSILASIAELKRLERECASSRERLAIYDYLESVFSLYERLRRTGGNRFVRSRLGAALQKRIDKVRKHPIRIILDATSRADGKIRSRWCRALRYAWRRRHTWNSLKVFFSRNEGIAGCARQHAAARWDIRRRGPHYAIVRPSPSEVRSVEGECIPETLSDA